MEELDWKEQIKEVMNSLIRYCGTANIEPRIKDIISIVEAQKLVNVEARVSPKVADNDISNWEVYHSNSSDTGICYNHPKAGDESVMIRNKVTNKFSFLQLNK